MLKVLVLKVLQATAGAKGATGDKYAIVPSEVEGVYVGLICTEMPEARFEDVIKIATKNFMYNTKFQKHLDT